MQILMFPEYNVSFVNETVNTAYKTLCSEYQTFFKIIFYSAMIKYAHKSILISQRCSQT